MDFSKAYGARFRLVGVDPRTWHDGPRCAPVLDVSATSDVTGDAPAIDAGDCTLDGEGASGWVRLVADCEQGGAVESYPLGTWQADPDGIESETGATEASCVLLSVLSRASERQLGRGWYAPAGADGADVAYSLLSEVVDAPVERAEGKGPELVRNVLANSGDTYLDMAWYVLGSTWEIYVSADGAVTVRPRPTGPSAVIGEDIVFDAGVSDRTETSGVPNAYTATSGDETYTAVDEDPASIFSTESRGRRIDAPLDADPDTSDESLAAYCERRLAEEQAKARTVEIEREFVPGVRPGDVVELRLPTYGISGPFRVVAQDYEIWPGITVGETLEAV